MPFQLFVVFKGNPLKHLEYFKLYFLVLASNE